MKAAIAAAILMASVHAGQAADDTRFRQLGECMAYFAVASGMDGRKEVDPAIARMLSVLGSELMFEASLLGYDDDRAHTAVVEKLVELNTVANEKGAEAVSASHGAMCTALASKTMPAGEKD